MAVSLCQFGQGDGKQWDSYVSNNPRANHCHLSGWKDVIVKSYGHRPYYLWHATNGIVDGILPLISMRSLLANRIFVSLPFLDNGGICADDEKVEQALLQEAVRLAESEHAELIDFRNRQKSRLGLSAHGSKVTLVLKLGGDTDLMWKKFNAKVRNQVRKAGKSGLTISWHDMDGLDDFYHVFLINMRSLGSPVHSVKLFSEILKSFKNSAKIILVKKGGRTVGGGMVLFFNGTVLVPWASSLREFRSQCPNNLLYWEAIRWACERGDHYFDFGRSSRGSGTFHFKKQWGAEEKPLHWESWTKGGAGPSTIQADDPRYNFVTKVWSMLPLPMTRVLGPVIRGHLSN
jgi:FemAB-related protein (PEP-CTERM system-associated)